jgi:P27 family predicted phage terminase small subunit
MRGRPKKPTQIKIAEGNRSRVPLDPSIEPKFQSGIAEAPDCFTDYAKEEWDDITAMIDEAGILTKPDGKALSAYCTVYAIWRKACEDFKNGGCHLIATNPNSGRETIDPLVTIIEQYGSKMLTYLVQFGLTPASRSKVLVSKPKDSDENFENFQQNKQKLRGQLRQITGTN